MNTCCARRIHKLNNRPIILNHHSRACTGTAAAGVRFKKYKMMQVTRIILLSITLLSGKKYYFIDSY